MTDAPLAPSEALLKFWVEEVGPDGWYEGGEALDAAIRDRYLATWDEAVAGSLGLWLTSPFSALAYVVLTDQFPRNMFRGDPRAFATDPQARAAAKGAIGRDWDLRLHEPERHFFYLPLMHSESLVDQDRCVRLVASRLPRTGTEHVLHARAHREQIRRFGRFPMRNAALGRADTPAERDFLAAGGYRALVDEMRRDA